MLNLLVCGERVEIIMIVIAISIACALASFLELFEAFGAFESGFESGRRRNARFAVLLLLWVLLFL